MRVRFGYDFDEAGRASGLNSSASSALSPAAAAVPVLVAPEASSFALTAPKLASESLAAGLSSAPGDAYVSRAPVAAAVTSAPSADNSFGGSYTGGHFTGHMAGAPTSGGVNGSSGPGLTVRLNQVWDAGDNRYEFSGNQDIDAVLIGSKWANSSLTFSFPTSGSFYQTPYYDSGYLTNHVVFNAAQQAAVRYALNTLIYGYTLLSFTEVTESNTTHANLRFSQTTDGSLPSAEGNFPGSDSWDGDVWFGQTNQPFYLTPQIGNWGMATIMHEIGHALGLKHGHQDYTTFDLSAGGYVDGPGPRYGTRALSAAHDSWAYSLMTYRSASGYAADFQGDQFNQPQTYMQNDIAALQYMYGAWFGYNSGNTVYTFNTTTGEMFINGVGQGTPTLNAGAGKIFRTIWDGNGIDTYDFSNFTDNQSINLAPGAWSTMSNARLVDLRPLDGGANPLAPGNVANALLYNNDTRSLIENANGGSGNDSIYGNVANNTLVGNSGDDYLDGWTGNDSLSGGIGNDDLLGYTGNDSLNGGAGDDSLYGESDNDILSGDVGNDYLSGSDGNDSLYAGDGNDSSFGFAGNDYIDAWVGADSAGGGTGDDTILGYSGNDTLAGDDGNDYLSGESDHDSMTGGIGNDTLNGGLGNDTMTGGVGDDAYYVDSAGDIVTESASEGTDLVYSSITYGLGADVENLTLTGSANIDGNGNGLNNVINGNGGNNILTGGGGTDTINGADGNDVIYSTGFGVYSGGTGDDTIWAASGYPETLDGGDGIDLLEVSTATFDYAINLATGVTNFPTESYINFENLNGGSANDTYDGTAGANAINGNNGNDIINGLAGNDTLNGGLGNDTINAGALSNGVDVVDGGDGNDVITSSGEGTYNGGIGDDYMYAGLSGSGAEIMNGGLGNDTLDTTLYSGNYVVNLVTGLTNFSNEDYDGFENAIVGAGSDSITGTSGVNYIHGGDGDDTINGGADYDTLDGGNGIDTLDYSSFANLGGSITDLAAGTYTDLFGTETVLNFENILGAGGDEIYRGTDGGNLINGANGNDSIEGRLGADTLNGGAGADTITSGVYDSAPDVVDGGTGNDYITSSGNGTFVGGSGNDTILAGLGTNETLDGGINTDLLDTSLYGGDYLIDLTTGATNFVGESYINFEHVVTTTGNDTIIGTTGGNSIMTGAGNDSIDGGAGNDTMAGGTGDDTYIVSQASDDVVEAAGEGVDTILSSVSYSLVGRNIETLTLTGTANINATGNGNVNTLNGNSGNNVFDGGTGADTMAGGAGNDTYYVGSAGDSVVENVDEGIDLVIAAVSYSIAGKQVENLTLTGTGTSTGTGNGLANILIGNDQNNTLDAAAGADRLDGGLGADNMIGGTGNDTYIVDNVGDTATEAAGGGTDLVEASATFTLGANVENLTLVGAAAINGTGNTGNNVLTGNTGNNVLTGGLGNDTYYIQNAGDSVVEAAGAGTDTVYSTVTWSMAGKNVETLVLTGAANLNATGSGLADTIIGNTGVNAINGGAGNDSIDGGAGADNLTGGTGNDTFAVDNAGDTVVEAAGGGTDLVQSSVTFTLAAEVENLTLIGAANINGTGNALNNLLTGNAGNNTLTGGAGNDTYVIQNALDKAVEAAGEGIDLVISSVTFTLGSNVENLTLIGAAAINGTGNGLANVLTGNDGVNTLDGGASTDRLDGGLGADILIGGTGNDTFVVDDAGDAITENAGGGTDLVESSITWTLGANLENLTLTGSAAINATGNDGSNVLTGNAGNNVLTGGLGNDTYYIQSSGDSVIEAVGEGTDSVYSAVGYNLGGKNIENLFLTGSANVSATGSNFANTLVGNSGNNTINGKGGADILTGGLGSDIFLFETGSAADTITDFSAAQNDTININAYTGGVANTSLVTQTGANVTITLGGGNIITVLTATTADVLAHIVW